MELLYVFWFLCPFFAALIAEQKRAGCKGFIMGLLLGPIGVIAAGFLDGRPPCKHCGGRLNGQYPVCPHCRSALEPQIEKAVQPASLRTVFILAVAFIVPIVVVFIATKWKEWTTKPAGEPARQIESLPIYRSGRV